MEKIIKGMKHDHGGKDVTLRRETELKANRTARLLKECGYTEVTIEDTTVVVPE